MSSSFFKEFYFLIIFIMIFSILVIILFIPVFTSNSNISFIYDAPKTSSFTSKQESIQMNQNTGFIWPTPRLLYHIF